MALVRPLYEEKKGISRNKIPAKSRLVDWESRDKELAKQARKVAKMLYRARPPVKITANQIVLAIKEKNLISWNLVVVRQHREYLPKAYKVFEEFEDTKESYILRKIDYVVKLYENRESLAQGI